MTWPCVPRMRQGNKSIWKTHAPATTGFHVCRFHGDPTRRDAATRGDRGGNAKDGHWPGPDGLATGTTPRHSSAQRSVWAGATAYSVLPHICISKTDGVLWSVGEVSLVLLYHYITAILKIVGTLSIPYIHKWICYQRIAQQFYLSTYGGLLQHASAVSCSHAEEVLIYKDCTTYVATAYQCTGFTSQEFRRELYKFQIFRWTWFWVQYNVSIYIYIRV